MASTNHVAQDALQVGRLTGTQAQRPQQLFNTCRAAELLECLLDRLKLDVQKYTVANTPGVNVASTTVAALRST